MKRVQFKGTGNAENKGRVCFEGILGNSYTLCGATLDGDPETEGEYTATTQKTNCEHCIAIVIFCKSIPKNKYNQTADKR